MIYFVINTASPFKIVEDRYFKKMHTSYNSISKHTIKEMLVKVYRELSDELKSKLNDIPFMACTTDGWSSKYQKKSFNAITLH